MENYNRLPDESFYEWKRRLCLAKLNKEIDLDWSEIVEVLGLTCSGDHLRKTAYGMKEEYDFAIANVSDSEIAREIKHKITELKKSEVRFRDQRREHSKIVKEWARAEAIKEFIKETAEIIGKNKPLLSNPKKNYNNDSSKEGVILFSDWHAGLFVQNHWNNFNVEELKRRVNKVVEKTIEYGKENNINKLHMFLLGDLINGLIHVTTRINNTEDVVRQTQIVSEILAEISVKFSNEFEEVKIYTVRGNHDRITANKKDELAKESFVDFIPWYLMARLSHIKNIEIVENTYDDEIIIAEICGKFKVAGVHGHRDRVSSVVQDITLMTKQFVDYIFMGHVHHNFSTEIHSVEVIVNPSLSGVDDFSKEIRKTSKPCQKFMVFDSSESLVATYPIRLDF